MKGTKIKRMSIWGWGEAGVCVSADLGCLHFPVKPQGLL